MEQEWVTYSFNYTLLLYGSWVCFVLTVCIFLYWIRYFYKHICNALISNCPYNNQNETAKTTYYNGTEPYYQNDSKEMLSIDFLCLLSVLLPIQDSAVLQNTTDNDVGKV